MIVVPPVPAALAVADDWAAGAAVAVEVEFEFEPLVLVVVFVHPLAQSATTNAGKPSVQSDRFTSVPPSDHYRMAGGDSVPTGQRQPKAGGQRRAPMARIRMATLDDAEALAAIYGPIVERTLISFEERAPGPDGMRERLAKVRATHPWLVLEDRGVLGYAYATVHRERAAYRFAVDTSVYVAEAARRRGVGRRLYAALFRLLRAQGFFRAFAGVTLPNDASLGLHAALGFEPVGVYRSAGFKFGAWHDVMWLGRTLRDGLPEREPEALASLDARSIAAVLAEAPV